MGILILLVGGLLFLYFNVMFKVKINISYTFLHVHTYMIIFKKKYEFNKKTIDYRIASKIINKDTGERTKFNEEINYYKKYFKHLRKMKKYFFIKNIYFYPESIFEKQSFSIEFVVVNRILKKSLLNG